MYYILLMSKVSKEAPLAARDAALKNGPEGRLIERACRSVLRTLGSEALDMIKPSRSMDVT